MDEGQGYIVVDTESSGLFKKDPITRKFLPADAADQPHLAAFCGILVDPNLEIQEVHNMPIKPDGWVMEPEATQVNGLTQEYLEAHGQPVEGAVDLYVNAIAQGRIVVAFNAWFDLKLMRGAMRRAGRPDMLEQTKSICVMWALGRPRKLLVACAELGIEYHGMHSALGDANAALEIARKLRRTSRLPEPRMAKVSSNLSGNEAEAT